MNNALPLWDSEDLYDKSRHVQLSEVIPGSFYENTYRKAAWITCEAREEKRMCYVAWG